MNLLLELSGTQSGTRGQSILLNMRDKRGLTLMHAIEHGHGKFVEALFKASADLVLRFLIRSVGITAYMRHAR